MQLTQLSLSFFSRWSPFWRSFGNEVALIKVIAGLPKPLSDHKSEPVNDGGHWLNWPHPFEPLD